MRVVKLGVKNLNLIHCPSPTGSPSPAIWTGTCASTERTARLSWHDSRNKRSNLLRHIPQGRTHFPTGNLRARSITTVAPRPRWWPLRLAVDRPLVRPHPLREPQEALPWLDRQTTEAPCRSPRLDIPRPAVPTMGLTSNHSHRLRPRPITIIISCPTLKSTITINSSATNTTILASLGTTL